MKSPEAAAAPGRRIETFQIGMTASPQHLSGTDRYYLELLQHLPEQNIGVRGMVIGEPERLEGGMPGVVSFAANGLEPRLQRWRRSRRVFRQAIGGCELVVSHGLPHAFPVLDLMGRRPFVVQFHGPWAFEARAEGLGRVTALVRRLQEVSVYRRAVRFITLSQSFGKILTGDFGVDPAKLRVIPGGVNLARYAPAMTRREARERLGLPLDRPIVASTRRLEPSKGIPDLIAAMALVRASHPEALCILSGTGSLHAELAQRAATGGTEGAVRFLGHVEDEVLRTLYRAADLTVVPSVAWEGFGLSVIESLASGTPVIVTDVGGLPEVVRELDPSTIVPPREPAVLATRIIRALGGEIASEAECVAYAQRFGWQAIAARVAAVYREAVA